MVGREDDRLTLKIKVDDNDFDNSGTLIIKVDDNDFDNSVTLIIKVDDNDFDNSVPLIIKVDDTDKHGGASGSNRGNMGGHFCLLRIPRDIDIVQ